MKCLAFTWVYHRWVCSLSFHTSLDVCIPIRILKCPRGPPDRPSPSHGRSRRSAPCATPWTWWCLWGGSPSARPRLSVEQFAGHLVRTVNTREIYVNLVTPIKSYRYSCDDRRLPLNQLEDLGLCIFSGFFFIFLPSKLSECCFEFIKRDGSTGFLPEKL